MPDNENKEAEKEVETEPVESRFEVPAAEAVADGETVDVKPTDEEKKTKKTTKDKLVSSLSFLKKKLPKKKVATNEAAKNDEETKEEEADVKEEEVKENTEPGQEKDEEKPEVEEKSQQAEDKKEVEAEVAEPKAESSIGTDEKKED